MTTYEGGIRVPSVIRWPGVLPAGVTLNGIQAHEDMFTTLAVAAGVEDPVAKVREEKNQYIDGVNNWPYWTGDADASARRHIFHYYESQMMAARLGPWKMHFSTKEDYYAPVQPRTTPMFYNLRADPYESYDDVSAQAHLVQKVSWLFQPMNVLMAEHLQSLVDFPPVQGGASFDMTNIVEDFINKAQQ